MLILSRKANERVVINDDIIVTVVELRGTKVRLGIDAPKGVRVDRYEVWDEMRRARVQAAQEQSERDRSRPLGEGDR